MHSPDPSRVADRSYFHLPLFRPMSWGKLMGSGQKCRSTKTFAGECFVAKACVISLRYCASPGMNMGGACSWARRLMKICSTQPRRTAELENGGEKKGKVESRRLKSTVVGKIRRPTSAKGRRLKAMHAVSMHRYRAVSLTLLFELVDSAASYERSRSLLRILIFLSKLRKHDLEDNRISLSTVGSKQSFLTEAFDRVEHRYESGTASESAKRAHVFVGLYSSVHSSVSFGGSGLLMTAPKHFEAFAVEPVRFKVRRRCDNCICLE